LREMLEAAGNYVQRLAEENLAAEREKASKPKAKRPSAAEARARREQRASLDPDLCRRCQKNPIYTTRNGVRYGSLCSKCMTHDRHVREGKITAHNAAKSKQEGRTSCR